MGSLGSDSLSAGDAGVGGGIPQIIDIRSDTAGFELKKDIIAGLRSTSGEGKTLPTLLLYNEEGLKLFEKITYLDEYYLTGEEIGVLETYADRIAERIPAGARVVELGSGNLRKIKILLEALDRAEKNVSYYALDLMQSELDRTLAAVPDGTYRHVKCHGLLGTYDDGFEWLKRPENAGAPKVVLSMGSSIGNFAPKEAADFLAEITKILGPGDMMLIGLDACQDPAKVYHAYNDRYDITHEFTLNGLKHANKLLGYEAFKLEDWEAIGEFVYDRVGCRHRASVVPLRDVTVEGVLVKKGEKVRIEESYKFSSLESDTLWRQSRLLDSKKNIFNGRVVEATRWGNRDGSYVLHLLARTPMHFPLDPDEYACQSVPSLKEWHELWKTWDMVTRHMIPENGICDKPIKLRNACIFYLGHIPTFLDIKITEALKGKPTEPSYFRKFFERGIDPDVDNPEKVHAHSEIPDTWPEVTEILKYQSRVRERVYGFYESGEANANPWLGRAIWLGFEHEIMHLETLLYMLIQSNKTLPPLKTVKPDFEQLAAKADLGAVENQWFDIPAQTLQLGLDDPDTPDGPVRHFGWDVEKPPYITKVAAFKAKARPLTNGEYAQFLCETGKEKLPASWAEQSAVGETNGYTNGHTPGITSLQSFCHGKAVRTVYGLVPLQQALHWPVAASYDELSACAQYYGGRIPTMEEARSIYLYSDELKKREAEKEIGRRIPAVNGHLSNEGVRESPPYRLSNNGLSNATASPAPQQLFRNLEDANVGFQHWHPMPVTQNGNKLAGLSEMGGLWEWTSSVLEKSAGFEPMKFYPEYSSDFYDGKHNVVLGGSWATHPRIAGRNTFVNWYQRNYPYVWAGARIVKDV